MVGVLIGAVLRLLSSSSSPSFQDFLRQGDHKDGTTALHAAVERGYFDIVKLLLEADPSDQHSQDYFGKTPIYIAAEEGYTDIVKLICTTCTAPCFDGPCGSTALHAAIKNLDHSTEMVEVLIGAVRLLSSFSFQAFLRKGDEDLNTALHKAVMQGNLAIVKLLSEADPSDQHAQNNDGKTPIYVGAEKGYTEIVKVLCTTCTAPSFDGPGGSTALHAAIKNLDHSTEVVEVVIGAVRLLSSSSCSFQDFLRQGDLKDGNTALHIAVMKGNIAIVKLLLEADSTGSPIQNKKGETPIYIAMEKGYTEIVKLICTTPSGLTAGPYGTALHAAIKNFEERIEVFEVLIAAARLLSSSSSYSFQDFLAHGDEDSNTVIHIAVIEGNVALVKLLLEADPSYRHDRNNEGKTPMYIAAEKGYNEIVKLICTTCTHPSLDGPGVSTALHPAILNINQDLIWKMLNIAKRENIREGSFENFFNKTDEYGRMILELAVERNYIELVKHILVEDPAYQRGRGRGGKYIGLMPLIYKASDKDYRDIVMLLTETYQAGARTIPARYKVVVEMISAIKNRKRESVLSMLEHLEYDVNIVNFADGSGWTLLHHAAYHQFDSVLSAIIDALKEFQFDFDYKFEYQSAYRYMVKKSTPFHVAAEKGFTSTVILLLKLWPNSSTAYSFVNTEGQNILHLAALGSKKEMIKGILEYCPQKYLKEMVNKKDKYGNTPFHLLIRHGCFVPEFIMYKDLDMMAKNLEEWTPLDNFYIEAEIIAEQAQIRIALENIQIDRNRKFWRKSIKRELNYIDSVVIPSAREEKDAKFKKARMNLTDEKQGRMKKDLERYKKRTNTQIIVTALITTVTFTVGFTMPGGLYQSGAVDQSGVADQGLVIFSKKRAFNAFMVSDALALLLSTCSLFLYFLESMYEDSRQVKKLNAASTGLNIVSVVAMMLTFITGTYVVLSHSQALAISVCLIGSFFFLFVIVLLIKLVYDRQVERKEEQV